MLSKDPDWKEVLSHHWWILDVLGDMGIGSNTAQATFTIYSEAEKSARRLVDLDSSNAQARQNYACALGKLGMVLCHLVGRSEESLRCLDEARAIFQKLVSEYPDSTEYRGQLSTALMVVGDVYAQQGRIDDAFQQYSEALKFQRNLVEAVANDPQQQFMLSGTLSKIGATSLMHGRLDDAGRYCEESEDIARRLVEGDCDNLFLQMNWVNSIQILGNVRFAQQKPAEALSAHKMALERSRDLVVRSPSNFMLQLNWAEVHFKVGVLYLELSRSREATQHLEETDRILEKLLTSNCGNVALQKIQVFCQYKLALACDQLAQFDRAIQHLQQATRMLDGCPATELMGYSKADLRSEMQVCIQNLNDTIFALSDWTTLQKADPRDLPLLLPKRIRVFAMQGRLRETAESVEYLRGLQPQTTMTMIGTAVGYGRCASLCLQGKTSPTDEERARATQYAGLSLAFLKQAAANGFKDWDIVTSGDAFDQLRHLPEFQALIRAK